MILRGCFIQVSIKTSSFLYIQPIILAFMVVDRTIWDCYISTAIKITEPSKERLSSLWSDELGSVIFNKDPTDVSGPHIVLLR